jgi:hypothetical protein
MVHDGHWLSAWTKRSHSGVYFERSLISLPIPSESGLLGTLNIYRSSIEIMGGESGRRNARSRTDNVDYSPSQGPDMSRKAQSRKVRKERSEAAGRWFYPASRQEALDLAKAGASAGWERAEQLRRQYLKDNTAA